MTECPSRDAQIPPACLYYDAEPTGARSLRFNIRRIHCYRPIHF